MSILDDVVKVFCGGTAEHTLPTIVLEYSIRSRTNRPVEFTNIDYADITIPVPKNPHNRQVTTFSFQRFLIPQLLGFKGRGIYLDSDMLIRADIGELWDAPFADGVYCQMCPGWQSAVLMVRGEIGWRIEGLVSLLDTGKMSYKNLVNVQALGMSADSLPPGWNCLDAPCPDCRNLHFTNMRTQPWLYAGHKFGKLWEDELKLCIANGVITADDVLREIEFGHVRPSLALVIGEEPPYSDVDFKFPDDVRRQAVTA